MLFLDVECYRDYFLLVMSDGKKFREFEMYEGQPFDAKTVERLMSARTTVGFNSLNYDLPMLALACVGKTCAELHTISQAIVADEMRASHAADIPTSWDHIDLREPAPGVMVSLKLYGGRLHSKQLRDLPYDPESSVSAEMRATLRDYCRNDVQVTMDLYRAITPQIELRSAMSEQYGIDLRSKSDAQIAEAVLLHEIGGEIKRQPIRARSFQYEPPWWLTFTSAPLRALLDDVRTTTFSTSDKGVLLMPRSRAGREIAIGSSVYRLGVGGLHSSEQSVTRRAGNGRQLIDLDVTSYYPSIILGEELFPQQCGRKFLDVYQSVVERRVAAKHAGDKVVADTLKIVANGSFGKLGSPYSRLYAPALMMQVTITGQLALLMLIDALEADGIEVVSANTDGIVTWPTDEQVPLLREIVAWWEIVTGYAMEETHYRSLHSRDVNSYIAVKLDGSTKGKGYYAAPSLMKNPQMPIIAKSIHQHLAAGEPLDELVRRGTITDYLTVRTVRGGGQWQGEYLGKVVRWYWSVHGAPITYASNGNKVPLSDGAQPLMTLADGIPEDLDFDRYINEARAALKDLGYEKTEIEVPQHDSSDSCRDQASLFCA